MKSRDLVFTRFVRLLDSDAELSSEALDELLENLRRVLVRELQRRSLWSRSPRLLGIVGHADWWRAGALDELAEGCVAFVFVDRLPALKAHARMKDNVEGLVFRSIRNYLFDLQRRHDPLGYRIFVFVQTAVHRALERGWARLLAGDRQIGNSSLLSWGSNAADGAGATVPEAELKAWVAARGDVLLPGLVSARGARKEELLEYLAASLKELPGNGVETLRFKKLVDAFKTDVRQRWVEPPPDTALEEVEDEGFRLVLQVRPATGFEARQAYQDLTECVERQIEDGGLESKVESHLKTFWLFIREHIRGDRETLPSHRRMAEILDIPRGRFPDLFELLQKALRICRPEDRR
jgi:hypothetical protein